MKIARCPEKRRSAAWLAVPVMVLISATTGLVAEDISLVLKDGTVYAVANPYGFEKRLAIIDHLKETFGIAAQVGISEEEAIALIEDQVAKKKQENAAEDTAARASEPSDLASRKRENDRIDLENIRIQLRQQFAYALPAGTEIAAARETLARFQREQADSPQGDDQGLALRQREKAFEREYALKKARRAAEDAEKEKDEAEKKAKQLAASAFQEKLKAAPLRRDFNRRMIGKFKSTIVQELGAPDSSTQSVNSTYSQEWLYYHDLTKEEHDSGSLDRLVCIVLSDDKCVGIRY